VHVAPGVVLDQRSGRHEVVLRSLSSSEPHLL
jgi:hypothetical protein